MNAKIFRFILVPSLALVLLGCTSALAADYTNAVKSASKDLIPAGRIYFRNAPLSQALEIYCELSTRAGVQVDTNGISMLPLRSIAFTLTNTNAVTITQALKLFETGFYDAGVVAVRSNKTHVILTLRSSRKSE